MGNPIPPRMLGRLGERLAEADLVARGFAILARNLRLNGVEFDIVARRGDEVWFVEVKTRSGAIAGYPYEQIKPIKLERMESGAMEFLEDHSIEDEVDVRLVAASIVVTSTDAPPLLEWIPLL